MTPFDSADYRGLLAAVVASPADDTPRLVLADWLEENGDPERAEFVRAQCDESQAETRQCSFPGAGPEDWCDNSGCPKCGAAHAARVRAWGVWTAGVWRSLIPAWATAPTVARFRLATSVGADDPAFIDIRRGLPDEVTFPTCEAFLAFLRGGPALLAAVPTVRRLGAADREPARMAGGGWGWWVHNPPLVEEDHNLPAELVGPLSGKRDAYYATYPTRAAALDALSAAMFAVCRDLEPVGA